MPLAYASGSDGSEEGTHGPRRADAVARAVRADDHVPLPLPAAVDRPGRAQGLHGGHVSPDRRPGLSLADALLLDAAGQVVARGGRSLTASDEVEKNPKAVYDE